MAFLLLLSMTLFTIDSMKLFKKRLDDEEGDELIFMGDTINENPTTSIMELSTNTRILEIYPNPSNRKIFFGQKMKGSGRLKILDMNGRIIHAANDVDMGSLIKEGITISHLKNGMYFLIREKENTEISLGSFIKY